MGLDPALTRTYAIGTAALVSRAVIVVDAL